MSNIIIRPYEHSDRSIVRTICCDAADRGKPIEGFFPFREFAADLLTSYYTDYEPSSSFVALSEGKVIGYVQGSFDNRRYGLIMFWILIPKALIKGLKEGVFFSNAFWRIAIGMVKNWRRLFQWRKQSFHSHQGHMHIGIEEHHRSQRVGQKLVAALLHYAETKGVDELTASVHSANTKACHFFEYFGFEVRESYPMVVVYGDKEERYQSLLYVKNIK